MYTRALAVSAAVALGLAGLAGCGGSKSGSSAAAGQSAGSGGVVDVSHALELAAKSIGSVHSAKVSMVEKIGQATVNASGTMGWKPLAADLTMNIPAATGSAASGSGLAGTVEMRMDGTTMYMNMQGTAAANQLGGKHWIKMDLAAIAKQQGGGSAAMLDSLNSKSGPDPAQSVALTTGSSGVKRVGTETVDGAEATHYSGTVDVAKLAENSGLRNLTADQRTQMEQQLTAMGMKTMTVDLWVNSANLPVKVHEVGRSSKGLLDITVTYSDYGTPVNVQAPPASDTVDLAAMMKQAGAGAS